MQRYLIRYRFTNIYTVLIRTFVEKLSEMENFYQYIKPLHVIFIVTWFAGLFYIVRLFIYHTEAETKPEPEKSILQTQYKLMEKRLWYGITWPSMILTLVFGSWLLWLNPYFLSEGYFILKLCWWAYFVSCTVSCNVQTITIRYCKIQLI